MPVYRIIDPTTKQVLRLEGESPPTEQQIKAAFSRAGSMTQNEVEEKAIQKISPFPIIGRMASAMRQIPLGADPLFDVARPFIPSAREAMEPAPGLSKVTLPAAGQFMGGLAGFPAGATVGHPYAGSAIGGTLGRGLGHLAQKEREISENRPLVSATLRGFGAFNPLLPLAFMDKTELKSLAKDMGITGAIEAATAGVASRFSAIGRWMGKGIAKQWLGARVAERGVERGWKTMLRPKFFEDRVPLKILTKTSQFFNKLSQRTGQAIDDLLKTKYNKTVVPLTRIKERVRGILPAGISIDDLDASKAQKKMLVTETQKILRQGGISRRLHTLWETRKSLDKVVMEHNWSGEAYDYMHKLRNILNNPIKSAGRDIVKTFNRYAFVKESQYKIGKNLVAIRGPSGEIYSQETETFVKNLLAPGKDETIRMLRDLDALLKVSDKSQSYIYDLLLDYAGAESLQQHLPMLGITTRTLTGMFGGKKTIARMGAMAQDPAFRAIKGAAGRFIPTGLTKQFAEE